MRGRGLGFHPVGILLGPLLVIGGFGLHGWNERDSVRELKAIDEIDEVAIADVPVDQVLNENEAKLVHVVGRAETDDLVGLEAFDIEENALRVSWDSDIYQLSEESSRDDGERKYEYEERWTDDVIDSSEFNANNKRSANNGSVKSLPADDRSQAETVSFGAYQLSGNLINQIDNDERYPLTMLPDSLQRRGTLRDGLYYTGDPDNPEIGDERIEFKIVGPTVDVTVLAKQRGSSFERHRTNSGKVKEILYVGSLSKDEVISRQHSEARILRWSLRLAGFVAMWVGLLILMGPIRSITRRIPIFGEVFEGVAAVLAAGLAAVISLVTIVAFWLTFRPVFSAVAVVLLFAIVGTFYVRSSRSAERARLEREQMVAAADSGRSPRVEAYKALHSKSSTPFDDQRLNGHVVDGSPQDARTYWGSPQDRRPPDRSF